MLKLTLAMAASLGCGAGVRARATVSPTTVTAPQNATALTRASPGTRLLSPPELDRMMAELWDAAGVAPATTAEDPEFLRRVTLDLAGRVPTLDEVEAFTADRAADKRARLVERLLASPDYAAHLADVYLDLFIGRQFRRPNLEEKLDPRGYFVAAFAQNRSFDRMARELLTFTGEMHPGGPGVYLASHLKGGGAETAAAVTARLFMGVQISCAQCHDHPYDARYKQEDFYGLVAYFARTKSRQSRLGAKDPEPAVAETLRGDREDPEMSPADAMEPTGTMAADAGPQLKRPSDKIFSVIERTGGRAKFKKSGSDEETVVPPRFLGRAITALPGEIPRQTLARAVVDSDLFAKTMVDRTWAQLFGRGIVEPWDDLGGERDPGHPALLNRLAEDFRASGFDVKHLVRTLVLSRAYGLTSRASAADRPASGDPTAAFARAAVRRLTPEQLFRSLLVATGADKVEPAAGDATDRDKKIGRLLREYRFVFGDDEMAEVNTFAGNIPQALLMWNGEIVNLGARARAGGTLATILDETPAPEARLRRMFLAAFARPPTEAERARLLPALAAGKTAAYEDLFFALLTSTEMLTCH